MTNADINDLETREYIFKIGDRGKGIQARYDKNTGALIFPRVAFDYVYDLLKEALSKEPTVDVLDKIRAEIEQLYTVDTAYEDVVAVDKADVLQIIDKYTK